ncbi:MAG: cobalamin biosynthesis protein CbiG [Desulfovibrio sp.]|nr:cobalamin biosynthesis protein CbiG [Desulfovibrio sp.]
MSSLLAETYPSFAAHAFIGATGIAVRALAPLLEHKSTDAPVLVLDPAGDYVISLLAGHWGGGNELARHVANLLHAAPVITTASDAAQAMPGAVQTPTPALDLLLRDAGLPPVDWNRLPAVQAALLEGEQFHLWDPCRAVPEHPGLLPLPVASTDTRPPTDEIRMVAAHWRRLDPRPTTLRVAVPRLVLGLGCRKGIPASLVQNAVNDLLAQQGLEPLALAAFATVNEKLQEPALLALAGSMRIPLRGFAASDLALCPTPNPSAAAGRRFDQPPFSVCEAAALLAAAHIFPAGAPRLLVHKTTVQGQLTMAIALAAA